MTKTKTTNDFDDDFSKIRKYSAVTIAVRLLLRFVIFLFQKRGGAVTITVRLTFGKIRYIRVRTTSKKAKSLFTVRENHV